MKKNLKIFCRIILAFALVCVIAAAAALIRVNEALSSPEGEEAQIPDNPLLILVNGDCYIPENYEIELLELSNGQKIDERIYPDLQQMFDDMRELGYSPYVREGYRTSKEQKDIIIEFVMEYIDEGYSPIRAYNLARGKAAAVGNSEHQLGLAVDINPISGSANEWGVYPWLAENAWKYGFILRYPEGKSDITGIVYEPWHYRYVGKEAAEEIYNRGITLEEYLGVQ